jgi:electron transfer flavoprotein alpha subunit
MSTLLTYISINEGKIKRSSLEVLSRCNELAENHGLESAALVVSDNVTDVSEELKKYGPSSVYTIENPVFKNHLNAPLLKALSGAMDVINPRLVAFASTEGSLYPLSKNLISSGFHR